MPERAGRRVRSGRSTRERHNAAPFAAGSETLRRLCIIVVTAGGDANQQAELLANDGR